jgi:hypothetical protein
MEEAVMRRLVLLGFCGSLLLATALFGCGSELTIRGPNCFNDFRWIVEERQTEKLPRVGCAVLGHSKKGWAVVYKSLGADGFLNFCSGDNPTTDCELELASLPRGPGNSESLSIAFPPVSFFADKLDMKSFLSSCVQVFSRDSPLSRNCTNDGTQGKPSEMKDCWYMFYMTFDRSQNTGQCIRWADGLSGGTP